jgi:hypothetical protein
VSAFVTTLKMPWTHLLLHDIQPVRADYKVFGRLHDMTSKDRQLVVVAAQGDHKTVVACGERILKPGEVCVIGELGERIVHQVCVQAIQESGTSDLNAAIAHGRRITVS